MSKMKSGCESSLKFFSVPNRDRCARMYETHVSSGGLSSLGSLSSPEEPTCQNEVCTLSGLAVRAV